MGGFGYTTVAVSGKMFSQGNSNALSFLRYDIFSFCWHPYRVGGDSAVAGIPADPGVPILAGGFS